MIYWFFYFLMTILDRIFLTIKFIGRQNIPAKGSFILASNHASNVDPFILGLSCRRRFNYVAKESLFKNKLMSRFLHSVGALPIKRDASDFRAIRESLKRIKNGCPVILFPEGTRGAGTREKKPQPGIGFIAVKSNVPVIPAYIEGSDKALPNGARWLKKYPVTVTIGEPLYFTKGQSYAEIASQIMGKIYSLSQS